MNSDTLQGKWQQLRGTIKEIFSKLTDDDLLQAEGSEDKMLGVLQTRYGYSQNQAQHEWDNFVNKYGNRAADTKADLNAAAADAKAAGHVKDAARR